MDAKTRDLALLTALALFCAGVAWSSDYLVLSSVFFVGDGAIEVANPGLKGVLPPRTIIARRSTDDARRSDRPRLRYRHGRARRSTISFLHYMRSGTVE